MDWWKSVWRTIRQCTCRWWRDKDMAKWSEIWRELERRRNAWYWNEDLAQRELILRGVGRWSRARSRHLRRVWRSYLRWWLCLWKERRRGKDQMGRRSEIWRSMEERQFERRRSHDLERGHNVRGKFRQWFQRRTRDIDMAKWQKVDRWVQEGKKDK